MKFSKELRFTRLNQSVGSDRLRAEPLALSPRSSGTNTQTSPEARFREVPGLRTFLSQAVIPDLMGTIVNKCITLNSLTHSLPGDNHCDKLKYKINSESGGQTGMGI